VAYSATRSGVATWMGRVLGDLAEIGFDAEWHCIPASAVGAPHRRDRFWLVAYPARVFSDGCHNNRKRDHEHSSSQGELGNRRRCAHVADPRGEGLPLAWPQSAGEDGQQSGRLSASGGWWFVEPDVGRVAHGVPSRVDRLRCLGNAVVPQIPELIGRAILAAGGGA
jgi:DNA (cytosine-5)-methyltransferase 1